MTTLASQLRELAGKLPEVARYLGRPGANPTEIVLQVTVLDAVAALPAILDALEQQANLPGGKS